MDFLSHLAGGIFWLILVGLFLTNWKGANEGLKTVFSGTNTIAHTLQHP
jgi:hypothetical protein